MVYDCSPYQTMSYERGAGGSAQQNIAASPYMYPSPELQQRVDMQPSNVLSNNDSSTNPACVTMTTVSYPSYDRPQYSHHHSGWWPAQTNRHTSPSEATFDEWAAYTANNANHFSPAAQHTSGYTGQQVHHGVTGAMQSPYGASMGAPLYPSSRHAACGISSSLSESSAEMSAEVKLHQKQYEWMGNTTISALPGSNNGKTRTKEKYRVVYSDHQRLELEKEFHYSRYITIRRKTELSNALSLSERQVKIWFQNRRAKERKVNRKKGETHLSDDSESKSDIMSTGGPSSTLPPSVGVVGSADGVSDTGSLSGYPSPRVKHE